MWAKRWQRAFVLTTQQCHGTAVLCSTWICIYVYLRVQNTGTPPGVSFTCRKTRKTYHLQAQLHSTMGQSLHTQKSWLSSEWIPACNQCVRSENVCLLPSPNIELKTVSSCASKNFDCCTLQCDVTDQPTSMCILGHLLPLWRSFVQASEHHADWVKTGIRRTLSKGGVVWVDTLEINTPVWKKQEISSTFLRESVGSQGNHTWCGFSLCCLLNFMLRKMKEDTQCPKKFPELCLFLFFEMSKVQADRELFLIQMRFFFTAWLCQRNNYWVTLQSADSGPQTGLQTLSGYFEKKPPNWANQIVHLRLNCTKSSVCMYLPFETQTCAKFWSFHEILVSDVPFLFSSFLFSWLSFVKRSNTISCHPKEKC